MPLFVFSDCPSVSGWKAVDGFCLISRREQKCLKNVDSQLVPLSMTIVLGEPCLEKPFLMKTSATCRASSWRIGIACRSLVSQHVTVKMFL